VTLACAPSAAAAACYGRYTDTFTRTHIGPANQFQASGIDCELALVTADDFFSSADGERSIVSGTLRIHFTFTQYSWSCKASYPNASSPWIGMRCVAPAGHHHGRASMRFRWNEKNPVDQRNCPNVRTVIYLLQPSPPKAKAVNITLNTRCDEATTLIQGFGHSVRNVRRQGAHQWRFTDRSGATWTCRNDRTGSDNPYGWYAWDCVSFASFVPLGVEVTWLDPLASAPDHLSSSG
jgi:hypothetical protein